MRSPPLIKGMKALLQRQMPGAAKANSFRPASAAMATPDAWMADGLAKER
jgi:hypothetical protein